MSAPELPPEEEVPEVPRPPSLADMAPREERRGAWYKFPQEMEKLRELIRRAKSRLLIVAVGSGAIDAMVSTFKKNQDLLLSNVPAFIDTNVYTLGAAWEELSDIMKQAEEAGLKPLLTQQQLFDNMFPCGQQGAESDPELGMSLWRPYATPILRSLINQFKRFGCEGIVVVSFEGGGTGTLVGPAVAKRLREMTAGHVTVLLVSALPLRITPRDVRNARIGLERMIEQNLKPIIIDLQTMAHALRLFEKRLTVRAIYDKGKEMVSELLGWFMRILTHRTECIPAWDFGNLNTIIREAPEGSIGAMSLARYKDLKSMTKNWSADISLWLTCNAGRSHKCTSCTFLVGRDITYKLQEQVKDFLIKKWGVDPDACMVPIAVMDGYVMLSLLWGLDPHTINPPLEVRR